MPANILVPPLGESIVEATVGEWLKKPGDPVAVGDTVVRLETDKVDLEVGAEHAGVLSRIEHQAGEDVKIGDVLGVIADSAAEAAAPAPEAGPEAGAGGKPHAKAGAAARGAAPPAEAAPEKAETAPPAKAAADADKEAAQAGRPEAAAAAAPAAEVTGKAGQKGEPEGAADATPVARRVAEELGINLGRVPGSGPKGRITKEDVEAYAQREVTAERVEAPQPPAATPQPAGDRGGAAQARAAEARPAAAPAPAAEARPAAAPAALPEALPFPAAEARRETRERMSRRRQTIARRLVEAQHNAAMLTTFNEIDMTAVMDLRKRRKDPFRERYGVNLGFTSFFVKAVIGALHAFPRLNAEIQGDEMILKAYYDIGIAVGVSDGLVVPVLRDADRLSFGAIEQQVKGFAEKAQQGTLTLEDLRGGTFTITNGGVFGSLLSTPILNPPQVGILGLHKIEERPVARDGQVVIRPMMYVALSYDHRIVDGREAVQFLVRVKELIEDPEVLLIEG